MFTGKVGVVTGSTKGIGLATSKRILEEGGSVLISSRKEASVSRCISELSKQYPGKVAGTICHVGKAPDRARLVATAKEKFGRVDLLVLNAAVSPPVPFLLKTTEATMQKVLNTNVTAQFLLAKDFSPLMPKGSAIVLISSLGSYSPGFPHPAYGISKTAVNGLTKALAAELGKKKIRVNCVAPGMIKTSFSKPLWQDPKAEKFIASRSIMNRLGEAKEVANVVAFLLSSQASYITSETVVVSGGYEGSRL